MAHGQHPKFITKSTFQRILQGAAKRLWKGKCGQCIQPTSSCLLYVFLLPYFHPAHNSLFCVYVNTHCLIKCWFCENKTYMAPSHFCNLHVPNYQWECLYFLMFTFYIFVTDFSVSGSKDVMVSHFPYLTGTFGPPPLSTYSHLMICRQAGIQDLHWCDCIMPSWDTVYKITIPLLKNS